MTVGIAAKWPLMDFSAVWFIIPTMLGLDFSTPLQSARSASMAPLFLGSLVVVFATYNFLTAM